MLAVAGGSVRFAAGPNENAQRLFRGKSGNADEKQTRDQESRFHSTKMERHTDTGREDAEENSARFTGCRPP
jgi:hypothetical protein